MQLQQCGIPVVFEAGLPRRMVQAAQPSLPLHPPADDAKPALSLAGFGGVPNVTPDAAHMEAYEELLQLQRAGLSVVLPR